MSVLAFCLAEQIKERYNSPDAKQERFDRYVNEAKDKLLSDMRKAVESQDAELMERIRYNVERDSSLFFTVVFGLAATYPLDDCDLGRQVRALLSKEIDAAAQLEAEERQSTEDKFVDFEELVRETLERC